MHEINPCRQTWEMEVRRASGKRLLSRCFREQRIVTGVRERKSSANTLVKQIPKSWIQVVGVHGLTRCCSLSRNLMWMFCNVRTSVSFPMFFSWLLSHPVHTPLGYILSLSINSSMTQFICLIKRNNVTLEINVRPLLAPGSLEFHRS